MLDTQIAVRECCEVGQHRVASRMAAGFVDRPDGMRHDSCVIIPPEGARHASETKTTTLLNLPDAANALRRANESMAISGDKRCICRDNDASAQHQIGTSRVIDSNGFPATRAA